MTCGVFSNSIIATVISFPEITEPVFKLDTQGRFMLYGGILIYAAIVVLIGWWASRRVNNMSDFLVAGRRLPLWMASATLLATWFGAGPSMAATGAVFEKGGLKNIIADPFAAAISLILAGIFIVGILRRNRLLTVTEIVDRYTDWCGYCFALHHCRRHVGRNNYRRGASGVDNCRIIDYCSRRS